MNYTLLSSPLQGFTDYKFRNAFNKLFGGIDTFYAPYIKLNGKLEIKSSYQRDLLPENNADLEVIPQIITNDANEFLFVANYVQQLGYKELNWNLGCPYPMVTKSGMGSGLICTEMINDKALLHGNETTKKMVTNLLRVRFKKVLKPLYQKNSFLSKFRKWSGGIYFCRF